MTVDYTYIGKRIREIRLSKEMPQEKLAELSDISVTHMSHIETGSTKLGLPTIVQIANALEASVDELLCGSLMRGKVIIQNEFAELLADCSLYETAVITDMAKAMKKTLREKRNSGEAH